MKSNFYTISIEEAITPFLTQVKSFVEFKKNNPFRPLSHYSICEACEAVNIAILEFISTAEKIASNYPQISSEIINSCNWSRALIEKILDCTLKFNLENGPKSNSMSKINMLHQSKSVQFHSLNHREINSQHSNATFIQCTEGLMTSIERILLLADWITVVNIRRNIIKVIHSLINMDSKGTENFQSFMHMFSRFGADMVELGEISGQRQMDLKSAEQKCLVAFTRSMLDRSTMMILAVWKINFRHDSRASRTLRALVFQHTNHLLDLMMGCLVVSHPLYSELSENFMGNIKNNCEDVGFLEKQSQVLYERVISNDQSFIWEIINKLKNLVSVSEKVNTEGDLLHSDSNLKNDLAISLINELITAGQLFTQCFFICLSERQQIISLCRRLRVQLRSCFENIESNVTENQDREAQTRHFVEDLCDQILTLLFNITIKYCDEILGSATHIYEEINLQPHSSKNSLENGKPPQSGVVSTSSIDMTREAESELNSVEKIKDKHVNSKFDSFDLGITKIKVITICKFLSQISMSREMSLVCKLTEEFVEKITHMINLTIQIHSEVSLSKHAKDCADVLIDIWIAIISDIISIKTDIYNWRNHKNSTQNYQNNCNSNSSSEIMKKYKLFHSLNQTESSIEINATISAPSSPAVALMSKFNNKHIFNLDTNATKSQFINPMYSTHSMNSLVQQKSDFRLDFLNNCAPESPNPWLSVNEIERIVSMKGQVVIDLASQITMFSHNEGPLKTSYDLMNTTQHLVRELANFHAFVERNLLSDHILPDLDKFPSLISTICSIQNQSTNNRLKLLTKIDKIVELVRSSATLVTSIITNWRNQSWRNIRQIQPKEVIKVQRRNIYISHMKNRLNFEEISDSKSCFSDTTNNFLLHKPRVLLTRSSSMDRRLDCEYLTK